MLIVALVAALLGVGVIAANAAGIAKFRFVVFLFALAVSGIFSLARSGPARTQVRLLSRT